MKISIFKEEARFSIKEHNKQEVVTAFSGLLEMSRRNKVITNQEDTFSDILVEKRKIEKTLEDLIEKTTKIAVYASTATTIFQVALRLGHLT